MFSQDNQITRTTGRIFTLIDVSNITDPLVTRNAIQVTNISWVQVGHLPRNVAAKLSPLVDRGMVTVEGVMQTGNLTGRKGYQLQIQVNIYGAAYKRDELEPLLIWATPGQRGFKKEMHGNIPGQFNTTPLQYVATTQLAATPLTQSNDTNQVREILSTLEKISDEDRRSSLLENLCSNVDFLNLPLHPQPPGTKRGNLTIDLLRHQSQALQWAIEREYPRLPVKESDPPVQFWKLCKNVNASYYYNIVTRTPQEAPPILGRGALYADAMGMGKTLTMIALILATKDDIPKDFSNTTLIVVPLSVLSNWEKQIHDHCAPRALSCFAYYGTNRNILSSELTTYDIVLTTYQTVMNQFVPEKRSAKRAKVDLEKSLFDIRWKRIILDEGHTIRNPETTTTHAVCSLAVQRRWVLTGTPIINSPKDLGSLLGFLKTCSPLDNGDLFKRLLLRPLRVGDPAGAELLRALMSQICIRRTKEMQDNQGNPLVPLPPVDITVVRIMLEEKTKKIYDEVERISRRRFEDALHNKSNPVIHANVLSMLTRMRQLALHPDLIPKNYLEELRCGTQGHFPETAVALGIEEKGELIQILLKALEDCEECPICFNILNEPRITRCHHSFCLSCISEMISRDPWCPLDRRPLLWEDLIGSLPAPETMQPLFYNKESTTIESSAKIDQLIRLINLQPINEKSLVFSQFTSFLDKIAIFLEKEGIPHVQFDGSLSSRRRVEVLNRFSTPLVEGNGENVTNPKVMLISLKSGALGLNLTVANNVYLMDPWWQEGIESQAIDRVNRIGQKNPVHVFQMIADGTVESKVMEIQARKKKLINQAFSGMKTRENERQKKEARIQDLVELFGIR